jgi:putative Mn2+ efflux pump MntP
MAILRFNMDTATILLIAFSLAMDAFAVSITNGIIVTHQRRRSALTMALFFGGFQMFMPMIGWLAGLGVKELIMGVDHWIAFGLLALIGSKMIYDSTKKKSDKQDNQLSIHTLLTLSIATSIDALMVGLSFAFLQTLIATPIIIIGIVTFSLSLMGFFFGNIVGQFFGNKIKIIGGLILIGIGVRILIEHLS